MNLVGTGVGSSLRHDELPLKISGWAEFDDIERRVPWSQSSVSLLLACYVEHADAHSA